MNTGRITTTLSLLLLLSPASARAARPVPDCELARAGRALQPVVIGARASDATKALAKELADYLGRMGGATFDVATGDGNRGIVLGKPADFDAVPLPDVTFAAGPFEREAYVIRSTPRALYLIGATDLAVSHAAWDLLYRLGHRQFFPGANWEFVPPPTDLKIAADERQAPSFHARRVWYNWGLWGYNDEPYRQWCQRNRAVKGFELNSGHAYDGIIAGHRADFDRHPEWLAQVGGKREVRPDAKFCISNADLRKFVADRAVKFVKAHPEVDSISMDPSDGGGWCECDACAKLGGVSTRVVTLANEVAAAINAAGAGPKYVGMYAYNQHSAPPAVKVHPNVIPSATTAFIGGGFSFDQVVDGWQAQGATMGCYDYLSVVDWDWNLPRGPKASQLKHLSTFLPALHQKGVRFYDAESGDCWGPAGLGYYFVGRVLWDVREAGRLDAIVDDFLDKAFGAKAQAPMREFYRLITEDTQRRPPSDMVGRLYRQLDAAYKATEDPKVRARLDDLTLWVRHCELYYAMAAGQGKADDVARHAYRMRKSMMVHSYGLWARLISQQAALTPNHPLKNEEPVTRAELDRILADGIAKNQPVDPGFESKAFSADLVPAAGRLKLATAAAGSFPTVPQDRQRYLVWLPEGATSLDLKVTVQKVWANRMPKVALFSPSEVTLNAVATDESYKPDGKSNDIRLRTPHAGLHRVEFTDGGDHTRIEWPAGIPITIESGIDSPDVTSHFRGPWTMYFYVPKGTKLVGGWASRIANWAPRTGGKLLDADGREVLDFGKIEEGWFKVPVSPGQDGRLWKFQDSVGQRLLMTVPPYLARSAEELLLPKEVVEADR